MRASACASVSHVRMPLPIGMPNSSATLDTPAADSLRHDLEVIRLAANHRAQRDERVVVARLREPLQRERRFERAGHGDDGHVVVGDARFAQRAQRAAEQSLADRRIEARQDDGDAKAVAGEIGSDALDGHRERLLMLARAGSSLS